MPGEDAMAMLVAPSNAVPLQHNVGTLQHGVSGREALHLSVQDEAAKAA